MEKAMEIICLSKNLMKINLGLALPGVINHENNLMGLIAKPFTRIFESLTPLNPVILLRLVHEAVRRDPVFSNEMGLLF
jgi:hypothetical protein